MQYILTEEEYHDLADLPDKIVGQKNEIIQKLCIKIANNIPFRFWDNKEPRLWKCFLEADRGKGYCDECQVRKVCPYPSKLFSK